MGVGEIISDVGVGVVNCSECPVFIFFIKINWILAITRNHAEPNINTLVTRNLPFDFVVGQWGHPLMITLHCLWVNQTIERVVSLNVT